MKSEMLRMAYERADADCRRILLAECGSEDAEFPDPGDCSDELRQAVANLLLARIRVVEDRMACIGRQVKA